MSKRGVARTRDVELTEVLTKLREVSLPPDPCRHKQHDDDDDGDDNDDIK